MTYILFLAALGFGYLGAGMLGLAPLPEMPFRLSEAAGFPAAFVFMGLALAFLIAGIVSL